MPSVTIALVLLAIAFLVVAVLSFAPSQQQARDHDVRAVMRMVGATAVGMMVCSLIVAVTLIQDAH